MKQAEAGGFALAYGGQEVRVSYDILAEEIGGEGGPSRMGYGLRAVLTRADGTSETVEIRDITTGRRELETLSRVLRHGTVTPMALRDVVEDYLAAAQGG
jgi:hypothetical protein